MGVWERQRAVQLYRGQVPSPGRPTVAWREDRVRFWAAIARGEKTEGAAAESFFATIKAEIGTDRWPDRATARCDIESWIKTYNQRRLHSSLGYQNPDEVRTGWQQRMSIAA
jgi:transposase InsO family protein